MGLGRWSSNKAARCLAWASSSRCCCRSASVPAVPCCAAPARGIPLSSRLFADRQSTYLITTDTP
uniref:Uncharacterized protein n=1 Tax=Arundo donax TaxID=35708 RepID=A0A0A8YAG8_ARUDO